MKAQVVPRWRWAVIVLAVLLGAVAAWKLWWSPPEVLVWDQAVSIPVADFAPGTVRLVENLWVARQPTGEFYVLLNRDPVYGQTVQWVEADGVFRDAGQSAVYHLDGSCKLGPCNTKPPGSLYRIDSKVEGDWVLAMPERLISGGVPTRTGWEMLLERWTEWLQ